jgi:putative heme-binding domain-containing protein
MAKEGDLPDSAKSLATTVVHSSAYEDVRLLAEKILPRPTTGAGKALPPLADLVARKGEPSRGRAVFQDEGKGNCARCHRIRGKGSDVGPDLSAIGTKLGRQGLFEAILSPSAAIAHEYRPWILETRSAGFVTGYIVDETPEKVSIRDANGKSFGFAKDDVLGRTGSDISLMPEGLTGTMTADASSTSWRSGSRPRPPEPAQARTIREWICRAFNGES